MDALDNILNRNSARILKNPSEYIKLIEINKSPKNKIELCLGSIQEMEEEGLESYVDRFAKEDRIGYIHFRNVKGNTLEN